MEKRTLLETLIEARTTVVSELVKVTDAEIMKLIDGETPRIDTTSFIHETLKNINDKNDMDNELEELECEKDIPKKEEENAGDYSDNNRYTQRLNGSDLNRWRCILKEMKIPFRETYGVGVDRITRSDTEGRFLELKSYTKEIIYDHERRKKIKIFFDNKENFQYFLIEDDDN